MNDQTKVVKVLIPNPGLFPLSYKTQHNYAVGDIVSVPFRNKEVLGIVWQLDSCFNSPKMKFISSDSFVRYSINQATIDLIQKAALYYFVELGTIAKLSISVNINENPIKVYEQIINQVVNDSNLTVEQLNCLEKINSISKPLLIKGVTGSGKTEIYFHAVARALGMGKQALIMLPEIALSRQIIQRFKSYCGFEPAVWNSTVSKAGKKKILRGIITGAVKVVIGARSALFLPYKDLGIIVVDEEHDSSYKQDNVPTYNARDMAVLRGSLEENCKVLLASATPSIETLYNTKIGKYELFELKNRFNNSVLPSVEIVDMKKESLGKGRWLSTKALNSISRTLVEGNQALIFLNRRGYAPLLLCRICGYRADCKFCSSSMVVHKENNCLECHQCGIKAKIYEQCPECSQTELALCGPGIERVAEELKYYFPGKSISVVSKDLSGSVDKMQLILDQMQCNEINILVGTQVITKGYHFSKLTLVVVVDADLGLAHGDLRASEKTFQLLHQVGGRAGREQLPGTVIIQTYLPEHQVLKSIAHGKEEDFLQQELKSRESEFMPPFSRIATITCEGKSSDKALLWAHNFLKAAPKSSARILGPAEAFIHKLSGKYRYKILIIVSKKFDLQKFINAWIQSIKIPSFIKIKIDIDPQNLI